MQEPDAATPQPERGELVRRPGRSVRVQVTEYGATDSPAVREDVVAAEEPLEVRLAWPGRQATTAWLTMRTPGHDFELAAGWALHEGLCRVDEPPLTVAYCTAQQLRPEQEFNVVTLELQRPPSVPVRGRLEALSGGSSACGVCGTDSVMAALSGTRATPWSGAKLTPELIRLLPGRLREAQSLFGETGGTHAAALADPDGTLHWVREDVGRHNAADKTVGAALLAGAPTAAAALVVSARASYELVQKAVAAGHGALVAVGAPSSLAVLLAQRAGIELFAFSSARRCVQYA